MALVTETRNASMSDLADLLRQQQVAKVDVVAPATAIRSEGGVLVIDGALTEAVPDPEQGMVEVRTAGRFLPTAACDGGLSEKLGVHRAYLRRMRTERPDLLDANLNAWLHGTAWQDDLTWRAAASHGKQGMGLARQEDVDSGDEFFAPPDPRKFLVRCFADPDGVGIARAFLSDGFGFIDHLDVLGATLEGIQQAGVDVTVTTCDLTEQRMHVRVEAPQVRTLAPKLLAGYRSPFSDPDVDAQRVGTAWEQMRRAAAAEGKGYAPGTEPVVFAGFDISNSETGGGAAQITPVIIAEACRNGARLPADAFRKVHLGSRLEAGVVKWTADTMRKDLALVVAQARDAVATFLDVEYLQMKVDAVEAKADAKVTDAAKTIEVVTKQLGLGEARIAGILDHFVRAGQMTAGGVMNAITSYAQVVPDADEAHAMEDRALEVLDLAARVG